MRLLETLALDPPRGTTRHKFVYNGGSERGEYVRRLLRAMNRG